VYNPPLSNPHVRQRGRTGGVVVADRHSTLDTRRVEMRE